MGRLCGHHETGVGSRLQNCELRSPFLRKDLAGNYGVSAQSARELIDEVEQGSLELARWRPEAP